jgi:hypothetical protein
MREGRVPAVISGNEVLVNAIIIEKDDIVKPGPGIKTRDIISPAEVVKLARELDIIYSVNEREERVNIYFEKNRKMKFGFPVGAITAWFLGETGEK